MYNKFAIISNFLEQKCRQNLSKTMKISTFYLNQVLSEIHIFGKYE